MEAEERFRRAFESAPIGMALVDVEGGWLRVNESLCRMLGTSEDKLLARSLHDVIRPDHLPFWRDAVEDVLAGSQGDFRLEQAWRSERGEAWVNVQAALVRDTGGAPLHLIVQIEDVNPTALRGSHEQNVSNETPSDYDAGPERALSPGSIVVGAAVSMVFALLASGQNP